MPDLAKKCEREKAMVHEMIALYCNRHHNTPKGALCEECARLSRYAAERSDHCPFMETKTFCSNCRVHCYKPEMREAIRTVMRYSAPRMLYIHPIAAIRHVVTSRAEKRRLKKEAFGK